MIGFKHTCQAKASVIWKACMLSCWQVLCGQSRTKMIQKALGRYILAQCKEVNLKGFGEIFVFTKIVTKLRR